ncbi:hypothetical protein SLS54_006975 [Diplodia seriata]
MDGMYAIGGYDDPDAETDSDDDCNINNPNTFAMNRLAAEADKKRKKAHDFENFTFGSTKSQGPPVEDLEWTLKVLGLTASAAIAADQPEVGTSSQRRVVIIGCDIKNDIDFFDSCGFKPNQLGNVDVQVLQLQCTNGTSRTALRKMVWDWELVSRRTLRDEKNPNLPGHHNACWDSLYTLHVFLAQNVNEACASHDFDSTTPPPHAFMGDVVLVSIDTEHYAPEDELKEVGVTTLDTREIRNVAPGQDLVNWKKKCKSSQILLGNTGLGHIKGPYKSGITFRPRNIPSGAQLKIIAAKDMNALGTELKKVIPVFDPPAPTPPAPAPTPPAPALAPPAPMPAPPAPMPAPRVATPAPRVASRPALPPQDVAFNSHVASSARALAPRAPSLAARIFPPPPRPTFSSPPAIAGGEAVDVEMKDAYRKKKGGSTGRKRSTGKGRTVSMQDAILSVDVASLEYEAALMQTCPYHLNNAPCPEKSCESKYHICEQFRVTGNCSFGGVHHLDPEVGSVIHAFPTCKVLEKYVNRANDYIVTAPGPSAERAGAIVPCDLQADCPRAHDHAKIRWRAMMTVRHKAYGNIGAEMEKQMEAEKRRREKNAPRWEGFRERKRGRDDDDEEDTRFPKVSKR